MQAWCLSINEGNFLCGSGDYGVDCFMRHVHISQGGCYAGDIDGFSDGVCV